jgi:hypothetical protein
VTPAWSKPHQATPLLPLVLIGAWSDKNDEDRNLVERFTGVPYANTQRLVTELMNQPDAPLRFVEGVYSFVSREDSWQLLSVGFTNDLLKDFSEVGKEILGEDDPRFDVPANERYLAAINKKLPKFSPQIREGVAETIALLGTRGGHTPQGVAEGSTWRAAQLAGGLLSAGSQKRWFSLASNLPLLAEAAPDEFLSALECAIQEPCPIISALFENNADGFFVSSPHTSLMWALELLAWDTTHISRVALALAELTRLDTGGRINPRPGGVLHDIFRFWYPQTSATIEERQQVLDLLSKRAPNVAWSLLLGLIPQFHDTAMASYKPRWRAYDTSQAKLVTREEINQQAEWAAARLVLIAGSHPEKWQFLMKDFAKLAPVAQNATLEWLRTVDISLLGTDVRMEIWENVRTLVNNHHFYHSAGWALPPATVGELAEIEICFAPADPIPRLNWLFASENIEAFGNIDTPFEERENMHLEARVRAVREVFEKMGLQGILTLGLNTKFNFCMKIGECLARAGILPDWQNLLPDGLISENENHRGIALGYAVGRYAIESDAWAESLPVEGWPASAVGEFALIFKFWRPTWQMLRRRKPDAEPFYWRRVHPWTHLLSEDELEEAIAALLQHGRPKCAIDALSGAINFNKKKPSWKLVADAVDLALSPSGKAEGDFNRMSVWELCEVMKYLQADPTADQERLVDLEWRLLPLTRHNRFEPKLLHSELSRNAGFFAKVLSVLYRAKNHPPDEKPDPQKQNLWQASRDLLESWLGIPGKKSDGTIDADILRSWVTEAREICIANGRIGVCDSKIGEQL